MKTLILCLLAFPLVLSAQSAEKLKPLKSVSIAVKEPSDLCFAPDGSVMYVASDDGALVECRLDGTVLRTFAQGVVDAEAVYADNTFVYLVEERHRSIRVIDRQSWKEVRKVYIPYEGGRNKGYEALTRIAEGRFLLFTEKEPVWMLELNADLEVINRFQWKLPADVSAATWYNGTCYVLSDEAAEVWEVSLTEHQILKRFKLPLNNPEGIAFGPDGLLYVLSDDFQRMYTFKLPQ